MAPILDSVGEKTNQIDTSKVQSSALFGMLEAMEKNLMDSLRILELVRVNNDSSSTTTTSASAFASSNVNPSASAHAAGTHGVQTGADSAPPNIPTAGQSGSIAGIQPPPSYLSPVGQFSSPASLLTTAGSSSAVLAVSGIQATNLLITSSGALGMNQIASLTAVAAASSGLAALDPTTATAIGGLDTYASVPPNTAGSAGGGTTSAGIAPGVNPFVNQFNLASTRSTNLLEQQQLRSGIRALDFCYDDQTVRFSIIDAINLCVTVVAYATHTYR